MLDISTRDSARHSLSLAQVEFFRIELTPLLEGSVYVSLTATTVDEDEPQLLDQEIARDKVATIDDVLAFIRTHVRLSNHSAKEQ